jgi:hypothetical protein
VLLRVRVPSAPRVPLPRPVRAVGTLTLPAAALAVTAVGLGSPRPAPSRGSTAVAAPDAPPPVAAALVLAPCDDASERSVAVQELMQGVVGGYAVYLIDLEGGHLLRPGCRSGAPAAVG